MGELVMMFPTLRSFYCRKTDAGQTLTEPDGLYLQAPPRSPQWVHSGFGGSSRPLCSLKSRHPSHVAFYKWLCTRQQLFLVLGSHLRVGLGVNRQDSQRESSPLFSCSSSRARPLSPFCLPLFLVFLPHPSVSVPTRLSVWPRQWGHRCRLPCRGPRVPGGADGA